MTRVEREALLDAARRAVHGAMSAPVAPPRAIDTHDTTGHRLAACERSQRAVRALQRHADDRVVVVITYGHICGVVL